jgi:SagB-type dehydrogenase family enzyme
MAQNRLATLAVLFIIFAATGTSARGETVALPAPHLKGGIPLMEALQARHSSREFSPRPLPRQVLSDLLWAAFGVNRPKTGMRTAPSAHNRQEIQIYAATADGLYRYDAVHNALVRVSTKDLRGLTGRQGFVAAAPLNLVYVADLSKGEDRNREQPLTFAAVSAGAIVQNVYLYCASAGLATVVRGWVNKQQLAKAMGLKDNQPVIVAQTVGYPRKAR